MCMLAVRAYLRGKIISFVFSWHHRSMATPFPGILETTLFLKGDASSTPHLTRLKVEIRIAPVQHNQLLEKSAGTVELRSGVGWNLIFFSFALLPCFRLDMQEPVDQWSWGVSCGWQLSGMILDTSLVRRDAKRMGERTRILVCHGVAFAGNLWLWVGQFVLLKKTPFKPLWTKA